MKTWTVRLLYRAPSRVGDRDVPGTGFWNGASTSNQHFVLPKNGSKYYLKYTFFAFPVLGILGLGTSLVGEASEGGEMGALVSNMIAAQSITLNIASYNIAPDCARGMNLVVSLVILAPKNQKSCERTWWTI